MPRADRLLAGVLAAASLATACSADGRELATPVAPPPATTIPATTIPATTIPATTIPATSVTTSPSTVISSTVISSTVISRTEISSTTISSTASSSPASGASTIEVERLYSPANATAEMIGVGATATDAVTVDDAPGDVLAFDLEPDGRFVVRVWIEDEGAHTVCVADACGRVYTLAPDAQSAEEVRATIDAALSLVLGHLDHPALFPEWEVVVAGALSDTGGSTDAESRTVTVYRNRGRTVDDYVRTVLHEFGHVVDIERLDDADRAAYLELRGIPAGTEWRTPGAHRLDEWGRQPSEDFAEVMVALWTGGRWQPRTDQLAPAPDAATLTAVADLTGFPVPQMGARSAD